MKSRLVFLFVVVSLISGMALESRAAPFSFQATYVNRIFSGSWQNMSELNAYFSTYNSVYPQRSLILTPNSDFMAELESNLGLLGANEYYQIDSAFLAIGSPADNYATTGLARAYEILYSYDPHTVSWASFGNGGQPGIEYAPAAAAAGMVGADYTSWMLTDLVSDWLSGASDNFGLFFPDYAADTGTTALEEYTRANNVIWHIDAQIAAVPAPSAFLLLTSGVLGIFIWRRMRNEF